MTEAVTDAPAIAGRQRAIIALCYTLATMMQGLDGTIAAVALPHMAASLMSSQDQISWVLTSYIVATAIATPLTGWLSMRIGVKRLFLGTIAGFTFTSVACGLAATLPQLVLARLAQGMFSAALVPLAQTVLLDIYPKERHGPAMAWWGMGAMAGPILGPSLGGWITESTNWRWIFFINVPVGMAAFCGLARYLPGARAASRTRFDFTGFVTLALAVGLLQFVLDRGERMDWFDAVEIRAAAVIAAVSFIYFVVHTALAGRPTFFQGRLLQDRNFACGLVFMFMLGVVLFATRALTAPMLQTLLGYSVQASGWVTVPAGVGTMLAMVLAGRLVHKVNLQAVMGCGFLLVAFSLLEMSRYTLEIAPVHVAWPGFVQGFGLGLVSIALTTLAFSTLDPALRPDGASTLNLLRNLGSSLGISVMQILFVRTASTDRTSMSAEPALAAAIAQPHGQAPHPWDWMSFDQQVDTLSALAGYTTDFRVMAVVTVAVMPLLLLLRARK